MGYVPPQIPRLPIKPEISGMGPAGTSNGMGFWFVIAMFAFAAYFVWMIYGN